LPTNTPANLVSAIGGTKFTPGNGFNYHIFTSSRIFSVTGGSSGGGNGRNTGPGGGRGGAGPAPPGSGGTGGPGIIIIRYLA
jgi:hypothetical protein